MYTNVQLAAKVDTRSDQPNRQSLELWPAQGPGRWLPAPDGPGMLGSGSYPAAGHVSEAHIKRTPSYAVWLSGRLA